MEVSSIESVVLLHSLGRTSNSMARMSVASTRLEGMTDHLVLPVTHTFIMRDAAVIAATRDLLGEGRFRRA